MISILVLKDGQIVEQGNFKELVAIDGIFASMWADQVSSTDDPALSTNGTGIKKEISGYIIEPEETKEEKRQDVAETLASITFPVTSTAESADVRNEEEHVKIDVLPAVHANEENSSLQPEVVDNVDTPASNALPIIPTPGSLPPSVAAPVEFPTLPEMPQPEILQPDMPQPEMPQPEIPQPEIPRSESPASITPAVTFGAIVNSPPSRTGTPGPEDESKRKRISSQNFQRLARRISLSTRRQSSIIPIFKRSESPMARVSTDDNDARAEGSTSTDSPASSVKGDDKGKSKKKGKKATT